MEIFKADKTHATILSDLGTVTFAEAFVGMSYYTDDIVQGYSKHAFAVDKIARELDDPTIIYLLMRVEGEFSGYVKLMERDPVACLTLSRPLYLERIYLRKPYMGQGLGTALLKESYKYAGEKKCESLWLSVWEHNKPALTFYEKSGFRKFGEWEWPFESHGVRYVDTDFIYARKLP